MAVKAVAARGVSVPIDTGFNDPIFAADHLDAEGVRVLVEQDVPMNRQGTAEEVAPAVAFLASDDAGWVTGALLQAGGGLRS